MFKEFGKNFKKYFDYLMTVNFKELFVNTVILLLILVLAAFVFMPLGLIQDLVRNAITMTTEFTGKGDEIFNFVFRLIGTIGFFLSFIYLFNRRLRDIDAFKEQVDDSIKGKKENYKKEETKEEFDMPKAKEQK